MVAEYGESDRFDTVLQRLEVEIPGDACYVPLSESFSDCQSVLALGRLVEYDGKVDFRLSSAIKSRPSVIPIPMNDRKFGATGKYSGQSVPLYTFDPSGIC